MHSRLLLEEPIKMTSILEPSKSSFFPALTTIVGDSRSKISIRRGDSWLSQSWNVCGSIRFLSWCDSEYHQETLENLKIAVKSTKKLCVVMLDTVGPGLQVINKTENAISLKADGLVTLTPSQDQEASSKVFPINFDGLAKSVKKGDIIFIGPYLFTGCETTSVWLEVEEVKGADVICVSRNASTLSLAGPLFTLHVSQVHIDMPTLTEKDKEVDCQIPANYACSLCCHSPPYDKSAEVEL